MQCSSGASRCRGPGYFLATLLTMTALFGLLTLLGCVRTAECDEHVGCDDEQVCYEQQCLDRCTSDEQCSPGYACNPCIDDATRATGGHCIGEDAMACTVARNEDE